MATVISHRALSAVVLAGILVFSGKVDAQTAYPTRPVRLVVPFPPGGGADIVARLLAPQLQSVFGQTVFVENRAGAAGRLGTGVVAQAEADGHTLLVTTESSMVIAPHMGVTMSYDPLKDFATISLLTRNTVMLVVHPSVPVTTLADYIALARAKPGNTFYASSGVGGPNHLAGEIFKQKTGLDIVHVPFQGTGAAVQAVIANQVGAMWGFTSGLLPYIEGGSLKPIAVSSAFRASQLPDVPTIAENGVDFEGQKLDGNFCAARNAFGCCREAASCHGQDPPRPGVAGARSAQRRHAV